MFLNDFIVQWWASTIRLLKQRSTCTRMNGRLWFTATFERLDKRVCHVRSSIVTGRNWLRQSFIHPRIGVKNPCMNAIPACFCWREPESFKKKGQAGKMKQTRKRRLCIKAPAYFSPVSFSLHSQVIQFSVFLSFPFIPGDTWGDQVFLLRVSRLHLQNKLCCLSRYL